MVLSLAGNSDFSWPRWTLLPPTTSVSSFCFLSPENHCLKDRTRRTSLVVQWLRICLPMQGTRVRALVREDPTFCGATKPRVPQLLSLRSRAREPQLLNPRATTTEARTPGARAPQQREATAVRIPPTAMRIPRTATKMR